MTTDSPKPSASAQSPGLSAVRSLEIIPSGPLTAIQATAAGLAEVYRVLPDEIERILANLAGYRRYNAVRNSTVRVRPRQKLFLCRLTKSRLNANLTIKLT